MYTVVLLPSIGARYRCWSQSTSSFQDFGAPLMVVLPNTHHPSTKMTPAYPYGHLYHGFGPTDRYRPARHSMSIYTVSLRFRFLPDDFGIPVVWVGRSDTPALMDWATRPRSNTSEFPLPPFTSRRNHYRRFYARASPSLSSTPFITSTSLDLHFAVLIVYRRLSLVLMERLWTPSAFCECRQRRSSAG